MLVNDSGEIKMSAPRMQPQGMIEVISNSRLEGKLAVFGYGTRADIPNPGDLMIVTTNWLKENFKVQEIEFKLRIRGRDMELFAIAANEALLMWNENKHWLSASSSQPGVDTRSRSAIRQADSQHSLAALLRLQAKA
jgi:hypothetical protein